MDLPFPSTVRDFWQIFHSEEACQEYLYQLRYPDGFFCPYDGVMGFSWVRGGHVLQCELGHQFSLTANTAMHKSKEPIQNWFWAAWNVATSSNGIAATHLQKDLAIKRYETAFNMLHKLRAGLVSPDRTCLEGRVEVDETFVGGKKKGKPGRGAEGKSLVVGAVELKPRKRGEGHYVSRSRFRVIKNADTETLRAFLNDHVSPEATLYTDGWKGYENVGYNRIVDWRSPEDRLPHFHKLVGNLKAWLQGTHHGVSKQHLQAYLNEFSYRLEERWNAAEAFKKMLILSLDGNRIPSYQKLYSVRRGGIWRHPNPIGNESTAKTV